MLGNSSGVLSTPLYCGFCLEEYGREREDGADTRFSFYEELFCLEIIAEDTPYWRLPRGK